MWGSVQVLEVWCLKNIALSSACLWFPLELTFFIKLFGANMVFIRVGRIIGCDGRGQCKNLYIVPVKFDQDLISIMAQQPKTLWPQCPKIGEASILGIRALGQTSQPPASSP